MDPSNCLGIRSFADTHSCGDLLRVADKFTQNNFQEASGHYLDYVCGLDSDDDFFCYLAVVEFQVIEHEEFLLLPLNQLIEICCSDELHVTSEEQV